MPKCLLTLAVAVTCLAQTDRPKPLLESAAGIGNRIVSHIADGAGWRTSIILMNLSQSKAANFKLNLFGNDGTPQQFAFDALGNKTVVTGSLAVGGSVVIKTSGRASSLTEGWALLDFLGTTDSVAGYAIFGNSNGNEAAVPLESTIGSNPVLPFDNTNGFGMGVALANSDFRDMTITATFKDVNGGLIGSSQFVMKANSHTSFIFTDKWPFTSNTEGVVAFQCADSGGSNALGLAVLGLRFTPAGAYTSVSAFRTWTLN